MAYDPSLGKQVKIFGLFFFLRFCEAKPEAKAPWSSIQCEVATKLIFCIKVEHYEFYTTKLISRT